MKKLLFFLLFSACFVVSGQTYNSALDYKIWGATSIGKGDNSPTSSSAILELGRTGTNKGLLLPRVLDTSDIVSPSEGLFIYSIPQKAIGLYTKGQWTFPVADFKVDVVPSVASLTAYSGACRSLLLNDSLRGGRFTLTESTQVVDSGLVFPAAGGGYWVREWDQININPRWYGAKGDGQNDDSKAINRIIQRFKSTAKNTAVTIQFSPGTYLLKDIPIPSGFKICASQIATNNVHAFVPVVIKPAPNANYVFMVDSASMNVTIENLYIDCDYQHNPNLIAAIKFRGAFNNLNGNNVIFCPNHAVWSDCGSFRIINNNFQGQFAPNLPFSGPEDFHGTLHIVAAGDSYLIGNEIGAAAPYLTGQVSDPKDIIRDPEYKRIVSLYAGYLGNSYVQNNLFENGDQGAVVNGGLYGNYAGNRYEMNAYRGLRLRNMYYTTFTDEKFANNSLAVNGAGEDLRLDTGSVAFCTFSHPTFVRLGHPAVPTSHYKVKHNIVNYTGPGGNTLVSPNFAWESARYDSLGHFDNTAQAATFNWVEGQADPLRPVYASVRAGWTGKKDGTITGGVDLLPGTTATDGNKPGVVSWYGADSYPKSQISGASDGSMEFSIFGASARYVFGNGDMLLAKPGPNGLSIQSNDPGGNTTGMYLYSNPLQKKAGGMYLDTTGVINHFATDNMAFRLTKPGEFTFQNGSLTVAKPGGANLVMISDNTGTTQLHLSSDPLATKAADLSFYNATGDLAITATRDITLGIQQNIKFYADGSTGIPGIPATSAGSYSLLTRNNVTGAIEIVSPSSLPPTAPGTPSATIGGTITGTVTVSGNDAGGTITLSISGASSLSSNDPLFKLTFESPYTTAPTVVFSPASADAGRLNTLYLKNSDNTGFEVAASTAASLTASQTFIYKYIVK